MFYLPARLLPCPSADSSSPTRGSIQSFTHGLTAALDLPSLLDTQQQASPTAPLGEEQRSVFLVSRASASTSSQCH